ncbi:MAG: Dihydrolipoamide dehydrogenase (EC [uncultured Sulfurovum sp.]|uniref:Dihydrolipoyl dehydrogenase n=1 Tax=uncultured Sulfurovum sp. TaxID=269237 RepID=A0A6S6S219_9BACT|nr:MAG: Dihydrolipoamide dehydrogenase (EC [uncultured Sulfurovum sp.]
MKTFDIIIIGAGRGSNLAKKAGKRGKKVAIIEKAEFGGTCPNKGCVPSKLLIGYAHVARSIKEASRHFIDAQINHIDVAKIFEETNRRIAKVDAAYRGTFNENVETFRGVASFVSNHVVTVNGEELTAPSIVIATGTRPRKAQHEKAWTSDDIFPLKGTPPKSITVVGAGFIGCELVNFFDAVGIKSKLLVRNDKLLENEDREISAIFKEEFSKNIDVAFNTSIQSIDHKDNLFHLTLVNKDGSIITHESEALLYATGREANTDTLALENTNIEINERGFIVRDSSFETTAKGVYVVGDASGEHMLQHAAAAEVNHLSKILLEDSKEVQKFKYMPHAVFSDPEVASVGLTEQKAEALGLEYVVSITPWLASAKAQSLRIKYPRTKFLIDPNSYEILGCHMIGPESSTMMHQVLSIMHIENDIRHLKEMLYIHPALSEALLPAAVQAVAKVKSSNF